MALVVALEGLPGAGKTSAIELLKKELEAKGLKIGIVDIEQTGHSPQLRAIARRYPVGVHKRILLFWIMRLEQHEEAQKLRETCDVVFCDRYWGSTTAMDQYGNRVPRGVLNWVGREIKDLPDLTLFLKASLPVVRSRKVAKTITNDAFARRAEKGYEIQAKKGNWVRINADRPLEEVTAKCLKTILQRLGR